MACRVVVGEFCPGRPGGLAPDVRDARTQSLYDSTVGLLRDDTMANPSIYVTYHDSQAYPEVRLFCIVCFLFTTQSSIHAFLDIMLFV